MKLISEKSLSSKIMALSSALNKKNVDELLDDGVSFWLGVIRRNFINEKDIYGVKFEPSKAGLRRKNGGYTYRDGKRYTGTGTLFETGRLYHSLQVGKKAENERTLGTDVEYAGWVLEKWNFIGITQPIVEDINDIFQTRISNLLGVL